MIRAPVLQAFCTAATAEAGTWSEGSWFECGVERLIYFFSVGLRALFHLSVWEGFFFLFSVWG